ncbi:hypothetical protein COO60DRAFT_1463574 [Scenedesmus sp. NREL 46B-D3]|nr:hypothetical protein COO60DRAFT_1463574 [Scenedesmus sp. NREL 46B-D3]
MAVIKAPGWAHGFSLMRKFEDEHGRWYVEARCSAGLRLMFYRSLSEGFWRLLVFRADGGFYKGYDYITQTFVHDRIQRAIEHGFDVLPQYDTGTAAQKLRKYRASDSPALLRHLLGEVAMHLPEGLHPSERLHAPSYFDPLQWCAAGSCFSDRHVHRQQGRLYFEQSFVSASMHDMEALRTPYSAYMASLLKAQLEMVAWDAEALSFDALITVYNRYMDKFFEVAGPCQHLYRTRSHRYCSGPTALSYDVKQLEIKLRGSLAPDDRYKLLFAQYAYQGRTYNIIVNVVPASSDATSLGLYRTYVSMGIYLYKPFEYISQALQTVKGRRPVMERYKFQGHRLNRLWPLNQHFACDAGHA